MTKILYSPGFGAGWSTWNSERPDFQKWMLTYQPLIDAIERGEELVPKEFRYSSQEHVDQLHPALQQFVREAEEKFDQNYVCILGACNLSVAEVSEPFRVDEYDGSESVIESGDETWISI